MTKKIFKIAGIIFLLVVGVAIATPYLFKDKIVAAIKENINKKINAKVNFSDVNISLFKSFPKLSVSLDSISVVGKNEFENDTLLAAQQLSVALDIWSAITGKNFEIYSIEANSPVVNAIVNKQGQNNWSITLPDTTSNNTATQPTAVAFRLTKYALHNATINYKDYSSNMFFGAANVEHSGKGNFMADVFTLATQTTINKLNYTMNGINYIADATTKANADIEVDVKNSKYSFNTDKITLNDLQLAVKGFVQLPSDSTIAMDIAFKAPSTNFKSILSLIPTIYQNNFATIKTNGTAIFDGFVKGNYSSHQMPAYQVNLNINNGSFQYPDLPSAISDINIDVKVNNEDGIADHTIIDVAKAHINFINEPFDAKILVKTPISNPYINGSAKGKLDLGSLSKVVKMPSVSKLQGLLQANVVIDGTTNAIQNKQLNNFNANGTIDVSNFYFASKSYPQGVALNQLNLLFSQKNLNLTKVDGSFANTQFNGFGTLNNIFPYLLKNEPLKGNVTLNANTVDLNSLMGMQPATATANTNSQPFLVPKNLDLTLNTVVNKIHYNNIDLDAVNGSLLIANEAVNLNNVKASALNGIINFNGYYSTKLSATKPDIAITYNVANIDIQKAFTTFNTVEKLMPIAPYLSGKLTSQLTLTGKLDNNLMPMLNSLTGNGNVLLIEGLLSKFAPLEKLAQTLSVQQLQNISLKEVKTFFDFTNGNVLIKPFTVKLNDIELEIAGTHSFAQDINYSVNIKLPKKYLGSQGNNLLNNLYAQANANGVNIPSSETVNLHANLTGTIKAPKVAIDLKKAGSNLLQDVKTQVTNIVQQKIDSTKNAITTKVTDTVKAIKDKALQDAKDKILKDILKTPTTDSTKKSPTNTLQNIGKDIIKGIKF